MAKSKLDMSGSTDKIDRSLYKSANLGDPDRGTEHDRVVIIAERSMDLTELTLSGDSALPFVRVTLDREGHFNVEVFQDQL